MRRITGMLGALVALTMVAGAARAKDLGDILLKKGLITEEELKQAREEEKQKAAAEESRRDAIAAKLPRWLDAISLFGDLRTRYEGFFEQRMHARNRYRVRARVGLTANVTDEVSGTVRLASGNPDDPISTNQSFERAFTRKPINLDQAYITLKPGKSFSLDPGWVTITAGKFGVNAYRASELVWDDDLAPEGATETLNLVERREGLLRSVRINAFQWVVDELAAGEEPWMGGGQVVAETAFDTTANLTLAFADYHYENLNQVARKFLEKSSSSFNKELANSNRFATDASGKILGYQSAFNVINGGGEVTSPDLVGVPAGVFGDVACNTQADGKNLGFYAGAGIGKAGKDYYHNALKNRGDWGASYTYAWVEQDAVLALFSFDDVRYLQAKATQVGSSNVIAHIARFDYALLPNLQLTAKTFLMNALDRKASNAALVGNATLFRTQLDAVLKF